MVNKSWYETTTDITLSQGEIIMNCCAVIVSGKIKFPLKSTQEIGVDIVTNNLIILSQSCDLENNKIKDVLLAQVTAWSEVVKAEKETNPLIKSKKFREKLLDGSIPNMALLHNHTEDPKLDWSIVNFHKLYTIPKYSIEDQLTQNNPRLRLIPPYREHLAQSFARYFMRVGLPHDAKAFLEEGKSR